MSTHRQLKTQGCTSSAAGSSTGARGKGPSSPVWIFRRSALVGGGAMLFDVGHARHSPLELQADADEHLTRELDPDRLVRDRSARRAVVARALAPRLPAARLACDGLSSHERPPSQ